MKSQFIGFFQLSTTVLSLCFLSATASWAQTSAACEQTLRDATESYEDGHLIRIPGMLEPCMSNFSKDDKVEALRLITLSYIFQDEVRLAEETMVKLLTTKPDFRVNPERDPAELINLYNEYRTRPVASIGGFAGINFAKPNSFDFRDVSGSTVDNKSFESELGYQIGFTAEALVYKGLSVTSGLSFKVARYTIKNQPYNFNSNSITQNQPNQNFTKSTNTETLNLLELPVGAKYNFGQLNKFRPYVFAGINVGFVLTAKGDFSLEYVEPPATPDGFNFPASQDQLLPEVNLLEGDALRERVNVSVLVGAGVKIKNKIHNWIVEVKWTKGLTNMVNTDNRFSRNELVFNQLYVDSDFTLDNFEISVGHAWNIYNIKKIKR